MKTKTKLRVGDLVQVLSGREKGKQGKIFALDAEKSQVSVQGVNLRLKNQKPKKRGESGQQVKREQSLPLCKVGLVDPQTQKPTRIGFRWEGDRWVRVAKKSGTVLPLQGRLPKEAYQGLGAAGSSTLVSEDAKKESHSNV